jgi:Glycosyltransferase family 87
MESLACGERRLGLPLRWQLTAGAATAIVMLAIVVKFDCHSNDFVQYYVGAANLLHDGDPYAHSARELGLDSDWQNCYPPLMSYLCLPFALFRVEVASGLWLGMNLLLTGVLAWLLATVLSCDFRRGLWLPVLAFLAVYPPQIAGTVIGQVHNPVALLVLGTYLLARRHADTRAGLLLAIAILLKVFPAFLLLAFFFTGHRRLVATAVIVCCLFVAMTWSQHQAYFQRYVLGGFYPVAAQCFVSIPALARRLFLDSDYGIPLIRSPFLRSLLVGGGSGVVLACVFRLLVRRSCEELVIASFLVAMLLITPPAGYYHLNLVLVAAVIWSRASPSASREVSTIGPGTYHEPARSQTLSRRALVLLVSLAVTAIPVEYGIAHSDAAWARQFYTFIHTRWGLLVLVPQIYGLGTLLWVFSRPNPYGFDAQLRLAFGPRACSGAVSAPEPRGMADK